MRSSIFSRKCFTGLVAGMLLSIPAMQVMAESTFVTKGSKAAASSSCVAETNDIRRNHMDYMKHGRDVTVRDGDRSGKFSLSECIDCHSATNETGDYVPVDSEGQFCQSCHAYVAVSPACFQCHRTTPEKDSARMGHVSPEHILYQPMNASTAMDPHVSMDIGSTQPELQRD